MAGHVVSYHRCYGGEPVRGARKLQRGRGWLRLVGPGYVPRPATARDMTAKQRVELGLKAIASIVDLAGREGVTVNTVVRCLYSSLVRESESKEDREDLATDVLIPLYVSFGSSRLKRIVTRLCKDLAT